jgi:co-chaperonin GroES (HSP10)
VSKLRPLPGRILVQEDGFKYEGLIEIPDKAKRRTTTGIVRALGAGVENIPIGAHILYAQFSGTGIAIKNQPPYRVLSPDEILLFIDEDVEIEEVSA